MLFVYMRSQKGYFLPGRTHWIALHCSHAIQVKQGAGILPVERVMIVFGAFLRHTAGKIPLTAVDELVKSSSRSFWSTHEHTFIPWPEYKGPGEKKRELIKTSLEFHHSTCL